jgi:single-stranded-DNA-specific exonuclease
MEKRWISPPVVDDHMANRLAAELEISPLIVKLLLARGISDPGQARVFMSPSLSDLHDPFLMAGMESATARLQEAVCSGRPIMIYGDYDVDGITGSALLYRALAEITPGVSCFLPNRARDGYGLADAGIEEALRRRAGLLISVDCGITAHREVAYAKSLGIDCIITDHHETKDSLPEAAAVLDPKRPDCTYPYKELAGVGVAFKLLQAFYRLNSLPESKLEEHLDLVALGTIADIVPLTGENRILAKFGLERLRRSLKPGLVALLEASGLAGRALESSHIVFILGPRLNAAGRMGDADASLSLLTTEDRHQAESLALRLEEENRRRKEVDDRILAEAMDMVDSGVDLQSDRVIVLASDSWHQGVIGIVASRLVEKYYRPSVLISLDGNMGKGSARSIPTFHLHQALKDCSQHLMGFGGHKYAAGLVIESQNIMPFRQDINRLARQTLTEEDLIPAQPLDAEVDLDSLDFETARSFAAFAPFGPGNRHPVLASRHLKMVGSPYRVGNNHLKFKVKHKQRVFDSIGFSLGDMLEELDDAPRHGGVDLAYVLEENEWQGRRRLQLRIKDIKVR